MLFQQKRQLKLNEESECAWILVRRTEKPPLRPFDLKAEQF